MSAKTLVALRSEIVQEDYDAAASSLAQIAAWELAVSPDIRNSEHTLEVLSSYLVAVALASDNDIDSWHENFTERLTEAGVDQVQAHETADIMTTPLMLRKALSLSNLTEDAPKFGLRKFDRRLPDGKVRHRREADIPRFIYSAVKLSR